MGWNGNAILGRKRPHVDVPVPNPMVTIRFGGKIILTIPSFVEEPPSKKKKQLSRFSHPSERYSPRPLPHLSCHDESLDTLRGLGVEDPTWILDKTLSGSDVSIDQSRLLLPGARVSQTDLLPMMTAQERGLVNDKAKGLPVTVVDGSGRHFEMVFKYLACNASYRLIGQWSKFISKNKAKAGHRIQLWAFRDGDDLRFAVLVTTGQTLSPSPSPSPSPSTTATAMFDEIEMEAAEGLLLLMSSPLFHEREAADGLLLLTSSSSSA